VIVARVLIAPFVIAAIVFCCCGPAAELAPIYLERAPVEIVGGYSIGRSWGGYLELLEPPCDPQDGTGRLGYRTVVEQAVVKIGWDQQFILVEQHPHSGWILGKPDSSNPRWHIIVVSTGKHFSWRTYDDFVFLRDRVLHVPDTIQMRDAEEVYSGG
jgi:hypothetical protein